MMTVAVLTISDSGAEGTREDASGEVVREMIREFGTIVHSSILPDEPVFIKAALSELVGEGVNLILTTGGTGLSPRDITPEATMAVAERIVPGMAEAMRQAGMEKTPRAMLSRGVAVICKQTLIINLPGSPKAARESLQAVLPVLTHAVEKLCGDMSECAINE